MQQLKKKLREQRGASMIMAMFFMLIGVCISCMILAAVLSASHSTSRNREEQQAYLTVGSAAVLVRDSLAGESYSVKETTSSTETLTRTETAPASGELASLMNVAMKHVDDYGSEYSTSFTVAAEDMDTVLAAFTMDTNRNIHIVFSLQNHTGYRMELTLDAVSETNTLNLSSGTGDKKTTSTVVTTCWYWEARDIEKAGN